VWRDDGHGTTVKGNDGGGWNSDDMHGALDREEAKWRHN
jgi:hypothetical protein